MRPRSKITEIFSTFAYFYNDSDAKWITDTKLRRSIENCLAKSSPQSEQFLSLLWYKIWRENTDDLAFMHLSAYLQEPCYWAAKSTMAKFSSIQYKLSDYFQMGIAEVKKICNGFKPERSPNLKAYASMAFPALFKDILRKRQDTDICTNYALLRKVTKKRFVEALENAGLTQEEIARYKLAWRCFRTLYIQEYAGGVARLPEPSPQLWSEITNLYNRERYQLVSAGKELDPTTVEQWLNKAAVRIRAYLYPKIDSLDVPMPGSDSPGDRDLPELTSESLMIQLITQDNIQERQNQREGIYNFLLDTLNKLTPEMQEILFLYYKQDLTQQEIARKLDKKQVWISRRLNKIREILLKELTRWEQESEQSQQGMNVSVYPNQLKDRSVALEEWLRVRNWSN
ncbi:RNA polymerase sigma 70 family subunit [Calothrix sp. NIES-4071]|nr:RNA polymerase sigma 70 family subunit [Calothrix sp. NIES-4071]BAZ62875.1 RNA polymerase sigma 70 family subunit [Calothrix sp. NIES-4105]